MDNDTLKANRFKKIVYNYDLISGKVNRVAYQPGYADQFYHRYEYDAENKLTIVQTSKDKIYWEQDATYDYYRHGPQSRMVLGENQVQGVDYAYTIESRLKGVNSTTILAGAIGNSYDMGTDGTGLVNPLVARDAYGFSLNYFAEDYKPIGGYSAFTKQSLPLPVDASTGISTGYSLYNGNIAAIAVNIPKLGTPKVYGYRYDQLNRIKRMDAINGMSATDTSITPVRTSNYHEEVKYDPNGNILGYLRNGTTENSGPLEMDSLNYEYIANTNKLKRVSDKTAYSNNYKSDIDHQSDATNYTYDAIGNLIQDKAEGITAIDWTVYGKIKSITKTNGAIIEYSYDASGNRISQTNTKGSIVKRTYYVRDASGNIMSIYGMTDTLKQKEINLFGSSRLGIYNVNIDVQNCTIAPPEITKFIRGNKLFELTNHLGNVLATVSDKKTQVPASGNITVDYYTAEVVTATDYYPFGMLMPLRQYYIDTTTYAVGNTSTTVSVEDTTVQQLYKHGFNDTASTHPYVTVPNILNSNLTSSSWTNHRGIWTSYPGNSGAGRTLAFDNSTADTARLTLSLNIGSGKKVTIKSFSFFHRSSGSGYKRWKMYINGIEVGDSTVFITSTSTLQGTNTKLVRNPVNDLTGTMTVLLKLYDHDPIYPTGNAQGTFRLDDFTLNGYVNDNSSSSGSGYQYANKGSYRYGFNGKENDNDVKGEGNQIGFEARIYDPRLGRFLSPDPRETEYEWQSTYAYFRNSPISVVDVKGEGGDKKGSKKQQPSKGLVNVSFYPASDVLGTQDAVGADGDKDKKDDCLTNFITSNTKVSSPTFKTFPVTKLRDIKKHLLKLKDDGYEIGTVILNSHANWSGDFWLGGKHRIGDLNAVLKGNLGANSVIVLNMCNIGAGVDANARKNELYSLATDINRTVFASMSFGSGRSDMFNTSGTRNPMSTELWVSHYKPGGAHGTYPDNTILYQNCYLQVSPQLNVTNHFKVVANVVINAHGFGYYNTSNSAQLEKNKKLLLEAQKLGRREYNPVPVSSADAKAN
ncbi:RHS repeat protein [Ferruginibacter sp. HRS2-29]|uniref:RHS repeat protein n=1 Tax=Ferruginibacter sp. HRS2-29 TaxID=2487334 RepID=UPI0020CECDF2|nr:RHS repeat-associated core domain-containing protein [Ferruginibacter sp. HRS2-29]MCP9751022.1 hypothetical protein [Ferruginibacter sp. HRS2-29]